MKVPKERVDVLLVNRGLVESRAKAQALLMAGRVFVGEVRVDKPGTMLPNDSPLEVRGELNPYVSRGGLKLEGALRELAHLGLDPTGKVAVDVGASTGGFTDCLLRHGAVKVYAIDVGHGQLHAKLRSDPRVVSMEKTNAKSVTAATFAEPIELGVVDASFIGLRQLAASLAAMLAPNALLCAMVKPQFEVGREVARRAKGVIRDEDERAAAIQSATEALVEHGFTILGSCDAPISGPKGNLEHFVLARRLLRESVDSNES
ncbi:MAG: TlyA family RNA methyltransferase [Polyangiaceae bacterium]